LEGGTRTGEAPVGSNQALESGDGGEWFENMATGGTTQRPARRKRDILEVRIINTTWEEPNLKKKRRRVEK